MIDVLDKGYVKLIETWGSDEFIIEAARMSTNRGFKGWGTEEEPGDEKLLAYLYNNRHMTPFEMAGAIFEVKAPIFVFREWHRHHTQSYNEMSARYVPLPDENYMPTMNRIMMGRDAGGNKQAQSVMTLDLTAAAGWLEQLRAVYEHSQRVYEMGIAAGVPKELARLSVPVARYSRMRVSANLRNWLQFCDLRDSQHAPGAQWEIRQYADMVGTYLASRFPRTMSLYKQNFK